MGLLRDLSDADRSQYDKYSRPKAANVRRAPIKNAASDVGGTTAEELVRARLSTYSDNPAYGPQVGPIPERNAPPGLGRTDIVRGKPRQEERREARAARSASRKEPTYNPGKGDIGIKGSFDRDYIDQIITDARDSLRGFGSQNPVKERRQDAKDIKSVLDILESKGIGAGPSPRENLAAEREIDPIIDYNDPDLFDARTAQFTDLINRSREAAGSPTTAETLFSFGFGPDPDAPPAPEPEPQPEPEPEPQPEPEPEPSRLSLDEISRKYGQFATFGHRDYQAATDLGYTDADILKYLKEDFNRLHPDNRPGGSAGLYNEILRGNVDLSKAVNIVR